MAKFDLYKESQRRLIGSLLADSESANRVFEIVNSLDFEEIPLQLIFESAVNVSRENEEITVISVAKNLEALGVLEKVGGAAELYSLRTRGLTWRLEAPSVVYAAIVKEHSAKNRMNKLINEYVKEFKLDSGTTAADAISGLQNELNAELYKLSDESTVTEMTDSMDEYFALLEERKSIAEKNSENAAGLQGIPSLLPSLNQYTTGWLPGQLITIGARTGVGKSVFAVNCALAASKAGKSTLFFSLEMGDIEIRDRLISSMTGVPMNNLKQGSLGPDDRRALEAAKDDLNSMKLQLDTDPKVTVDSIRARALRKAQSPEGLDFIIVDYLQLITPTGRYSSRQEAVADISRNMKLLAKQLQVPIMVLVQVNRESKDDENGLPKMSNIRESGAIAQDSDIVILIHREELMDDSIPHTLILLEKNRGGEANKTIRCHSNLECSLFREIQKAKDVEGTITDEDIAALDSFGNDDDDDDLDLNFDDDF